MQRFDNSRPPTPEESDILVSAWDRVLYTLGAPSVEDAPMPKSGRTVDQARIPVTVLSGFLGAGKTTLLCKILDEGQDNVLAIVNDMASVNLDAELVKAKSADTIQLENGCACCVLSDNLDAILSEARKRTVVPETIILEASGISDPASLAQTVSRNDATVLDAIITLVDARNFQYLLSDPLAAPILKRQLDAAHIIAISKTTAEDNLTELRTQIGNLAPGRPVIPLNDCINLSSTLLGSSTRGARPEPGKQAHNYSEFTSTVIDWYKPVNGDSLFNLMRDIPESVYRIKGWLTARENGDCVRYQLQAAGPRWHVVTYTTDQPSRLVVIGNNRSEGYNYFCDQLRSLSTGA